MDVGLIPYINDLPDDILVEIFLILTRIWAGGSYPKILTSVCSRWRELALHTPLLWTEIKIALYSAKSCRDALDYFERSKPALIDARFHNYGLGRPAVPEYRESLYNALVYHASRLRKLVFRLPSPNEISVILDGWASTGADVGNLEYISMCVADNVNVTTFTPWKGIQALRSLDIRHGDFELASLPPAPNLNFLSIDQVDSRPETFQILFAKYPSLETLVIRSLEQPRTVEQDAHQVQAINVPRSLRSLSVCVEDPEDDQECRCILPQLLHADTLEHVKIEVNYEGRVLGGHHESMFTRWKDSQRPRTLLVDCYGFQFVDVSVLGKLPDTVNLELTKFLGVHSESNDRLDTLVAVLALTNLRSLTLDFRLRSWFEFHVFRGRRNNLILEKFAKIVRQRRPELGSPTFLRVDKGEPDEGLEAKMQEYLPVGSSKLTILRTPTGAPHLVLANGPGAICADPCYSDEDDSDEYQSDKDHSDEEDSDAEDSDEEY